MVAISTWYTPVRTTRRCNSTDCSDDFDPWAPTQATTYFDDDSTVYSSSPDPAPAPQEKEEPEEKPKPVICFKVDKNPRVKVMSQTYKKPIRKQFTSFHAVIVGRMSDFARN